MTFEHHPAQDAATAVASATASEGADSASNKPRPCGPASLFRTVTCKQFEENGTCRYGEACMFAHGQDAIRTVEQNEADGITTKEGVFCFLRNQRKRDRPAAAAESEGTPSQHQKEHATTEVPAPGCGKNAAKNKKKREAAKRVRQALAEATAANQKDGSSLCFESARHRSPNSGPAESDAGSVRSYRHNPYSRPPTPPSPPSTAELSPVQIPRHPVSPTPTAPATVLNKQYSPLALWATRGGQRRHNPYVLLKGDGISGASDSLAESYVQ